MKRIAKSSWRNHRFPIFRLKRTDIEELLSIASANGLTEQRFSDQRYEYESLEDLRKNVGPSVRRLTFTFSKSDPYDRVELSVKDSEIELFCRSDEKDFATTWHQLKDYLSEQEPWYAKFMSPIQWALGSMTILPLVLLILIIFHSFVTAFAVYTIMISAFIVAFGMIGISLVYPKLNGGIQLQREHEIEGFWRRYGKEILLLAVGAAFGLIVKVLSDRLTSH